MSEQCVVAIYDSFENARQGVLALDRAGFSHDTVSLVTHSIDLESPANEAVQYGDETEDHAVKGAGAGGLLGVLLGVPLLAIPGIGPLLAAGPIATGLTGAVVGGYLGSLGGWGVHHDHVQEYEALIRRGGVLIIVNGPPDSVADAKRVLQETAAEEVHLHARTSADAAEIDDRV